MARKKLETVFLTGSAGFIGANLLRKLLLLKKFQVHVLLRKKTNLWRINDLLADENIIVHYDDLGDFKSLKELMEKVKPDYILHLATYGAYPTVQKEKDLIIKTNFLGTINLLDACQEINYKCFIDTGSSSEYGRKKKPMKESDVLEPIDVYGVTKAAAELYGRMLNRRYGKNIVHLRLFSTYGYYEEKIRFVPSLMLSVVNSKDKFEMTGGSQTRDFIFVEDVVDAYLHIMKRCKFVGGQTFNIGTGVKTSIKDFALLTKKISKKNIDLKFGAIKTREAETFVWVSDTEKVKKLLKWSPKHNLQQGIKKSLEWFKNNNNLYEQY